MALQNTVPTPAAAAAQDLMAVMPGRVVVRGDDNYERTRQIWNGAVENQPALFVRCENPQDVQAALRVARLYRTPISVRGGGHDWVGRALRDDGMVLDLSPMRQITVDGTARIATVAGGVTANDLVAAAEPHELTPVTGNCGNVGMAGFTIGGGYGLLTPRYGLGVDNLKGADVVLANGDLVSANELENPELFWALRGGGGNFGVVTSMRVRLHPVSKVLGGAIVFAWSGAESVLRGYAEFVKSAPRELGILMGILPAPDGSPSLRLAPIWSGDRAEGEAVIAKLEGIGNPVMSQIAPMAYSDLLHMFDEQVVNGRRYAFQTRSFSALTPEVIAALIAAVDQRTSPLSMIAVHHLRGFPTHVPADQTAFGQRSEHFMSEIIAAGDEEADKDGDVHREWTRSVSRSLAPHALPGGYPNLLGPNDRDPVGNAYGSNAARLREAKRRYDPENVFSSPIPLPAATFYEIAELSEFSCGLGIVGVDRKIEFQHL